jgi:Amino acid permease
VQAFTFAVLVLAANTSYQGFPRLAAVLARDRFFPRQFVNLGDRLVYSNGIVVLAGISSLLIWAFKANVIALIHLYVIGVFTAFTLSQVGMVRYWLRKEKPGWRRSALINGAGAVATGVVALLVIESKFREGAWAVIVAIPVLIVCFYGIHRHYRKVTRRLRAGIAAVTAAPRATNDVVVVVESADPALEKALWYARRIAGDDFRAIHVPGRGTDPGIKPRFRQLTEMRPDLEVVAPEDGRVDAVIEYLWALPRGESNFVTVVVPELFRSRSLASAVLRGPEFRMKLRLLTQPGVVVTDVPVLANEEPERLPGRVAVRLLVSGAHAATMRAANYANVLGFDDTKAVFFAFDAEEAERMESEWQERRLPIPLLIEEAPFRDIGEPLLAHLRRITADPDATAVAVMPELVFGGPARVLHNQRALYIKRLLLFEPRVILASVPYRLN